MQVSTHLRKISQSTHPKSKVMKNETKRVHFSFAKYQFREYNLYSRVGKGQLPKGHVSKVPKTFCSNILIAQK